MYQRYDKEFKKEAIRLALSGEKSIAQTARDLGIKKPVLHSWINQVKKLEKPVSAKEITNGSELVDELNRLRKENSRLKEERDLLKKAAAFSAKEEQKR